MNIKTYGTGERLSVCCEHLAGADIEGGLILLPVPTTKDGVTVYGADITLDAVTESAEGTDVIVGYGLPTETVAKLEAKKCRVLDALYDEEFLCANAELTAIGTLGHILSTERTSPGELSFGIIGYGRIGRRLVRHLLFLGADVKVFTSSTSTRMELSRGGVATEDSGGALDLSGIDILINTAPARVIKDSDIPFLPENMRVIDLAAGRYLDKIPGVIKLSGVPDKYPRSAGKLYADAVIRFLKSEVKDL